MSEFGGCFSENNSFLNERCNKTKINGLLRSGLPSYYYICKLQTEYDMENRLTVGFTHGDVNGIGYELIIKMMAENRICEVCTPVLFGSSKVAAYHRKALNIENFSLNSIQNARDANPEKV